MATLKDRISDAEHKAATEKSPIAALFDRETVQNSALADTTSQPGRSAQLMELPVDALDEMDQRFRLLENELEDMRKSIIAHGIIHRIIVRPYPEGSGRYQIISGRRRRRGAILAGYTMVPCEVRYLDDDEARLQMLAANLDQREELLPSEKAWAYREQMEILTHQGKKANIENDLDALGQNEKQTSCKNCTKLRSDEMIATGSKKSARTIQNYIRLSYLMPELLDAVDERALIVGAGVALSYLSLDSQDAVYQYFFVNNKKSISGALADTLRAEGEKDTLTVERIEQILAPAPAPARARLRKVSVPMKPLRQFFPVEATETEIQKQIVEIVTHYFSMETKEK